MLLLLLGRIFYCTEKVVVLYPAMERDRNRNTAVTESAGARENGLSAQLHGEVDKLARKNAEVGSIPTEIGV